MSMSYDMRHMLQREASMPPNMWNALHSQSYTNGSMGLNSLMGGPPMTPQYAPMPMPQMTPKAEAIQGFGQLTWLSGKAGLITCKDKMVISFQIKDFCDQLLSDLTSVLRVGFTLSFQAALNETNEYTATLVQPLYGPEAEQVFMNATEVDLEKASPTPVSSKDAYSPVIEAHAIPALLAIFQRHGLEQIQLSSLHSQMSNCGDDELFRYVGTSSLKRRQFIERRTHLFRLTQEDTIALQNPAVYLCALRLCSYLLRRGGVTAIQSLYDYYMSAEVAVEIREQLGESRQEFLNFICSHPWIFALFPNRTYVSARRNLPHYDYPSFVKTHFPAVDAFRSSSMSRGGGGFPRPIARTLSANQPLVANGPSGRTMSQTNPHRPNSLWDSQTTAPQTCPPLASPVEWSPMFSQSSWGRNSTDRSLLSTGVIGSSGIKKTSVSIGVQTDMPICSCGGCRCGGGGDLPISRRSISPSLESNSPGSLPFDSISPASGPAPIGDIQPKYYDPFGTDIVGLAQLAHLRLD